jgi:hypothetical protein
MQWEKGGPCFIEDGFIVLFNTPLEDNEKYNPFDYYGKYGEIDLYLKFISLNEDNPEEIRQFVKQYGLIGIGSYEDDILNEAIEKKDYRELVPLMQLSPYLRYSKQGGCKEKIEDIAKEIIKMRRAVNLHSAILSNNTNELCRFLDENYPGKDPYCKTDIVLANYYLEDAVNEYLLFVSPALTFQGNAQEFAKAWRAWGLLPAMYAMFCMNIAKGIMVKECANPTCSMLFTININDKRSAKRVYCSHSCAAAVSQRICRNNKKKRDANS